MKRFDHRARVSASLYNRTLQTIGKLQTFKCSEWGSSYHGGLVYHNARLGVWGFLESDVVDTPGIGWNIPAGTKPSFTVPYWRIMQAHENASVYRTNENTITPAVTGSQLLLNGSSLKEPVCVYDSSVGYVKSDRLRLEDPGSELITLSPDNWGTPGRGVDSMGTPWAVNPAGGVLDTPHWQYCVAPEIIYDWYPAVLPIGFTGFEVWGGYDIGGEFGRQAGIHAIAASIGLPIELQIGPKCRIAEAKCELSVIDPEIYHVTFTATSRTDPGTIVVETTAMPIALVLLGGMTTFHGEENVPYTTWDVLCNAPGGTLESGKSVVVDVTNVLQTMLDNDTYDSFALLPSVGVEFLGGANNSAIKGLMGPEPTLEWDDREGVKSWYISHSEFKRLRCTGYGLSAPVVTVEWPASVLGRHVLPLQWPPMD